MGKALTTFGRETRSASTCSHSSPRNLMETENPGYVGSRGKLFSPAGTKSGRAKSVGSSSGLKSGKGIASDFPVKITNDFHLAVEVSLF